QGAEPAGAQQRFAFPDRAFDVAVDAAQTNVPFHTPSPPKCLPPGGEGGGRRPCLSTIGQKLHRRRPGERRRGHPALTRPPRGAPVHGRGRRRPVRQDTFPLIFLPVVAIPPYHQKYPPARRDRCSREPRAPLTARGPSCASAGFSPAEV